MAHWRKVIVSGSNSELNHITSSGDVFLSSDGAKMKFGADNEVTLTHVHNEGLLLSDQSGIGTTKLQFGDAATFVQQQADGQLGIDADVKVDITAPAVSMSNDLYVGGDIFAVGEITFQGDTGGNIRLGDAANDNLVVGADISSSLIPNNNDSFNLGSAAQRWNNLFLSGSISASGGSHDIDSDSTITLDSVGATSIDAGAASNFSTTAGDLTVEAGATNAKVVIKGDNESGTSIHLDGNQADASVVDIDAGSLDIDARTSVDINSTTSTTITTATTFDVNSTGAVTIDSDAATTIAGQSLDIDADGGNVDLDATGTISIGTVNTTGITIGHGSSITTTINGNLDVNGTLTTIDTTNLQIKDAFVQVASGSSGNQDGGLVVTTTSDGSGSAFYYDTDRARWALTRAGDTAHNATTDIAHRQFVMTVSQSSAVPTGNPADFGNSNVSRVGQVYIQTANDPSNANNVKGDIWMFSLDATD